MSKRASRKRRVEKSKAVLRAAAGSLLRLSGASEGFELEAAASDGALPKFSMVAYTGAAMDVGWGAPVVVDLEGIKVPRQDVPALKDHDATQIVGHTTKIEVSSQRIKVSGVLSGVGEAANEVRATAANGFPWQASIGAPVEKREYVEAGQKVKVNGRMFSGPIIVARQASVGEFSFVPLGADGATSATVAAQQGRIAMLSDFEKWVTAQGFDPVAITDNQRKFLQAKYDLEKKDTEKKDEPRLTAAADVEAYRKDVTTEKLRVLGIERICAANQKPKVWVGTDGSISYSGEAGLAVDLEAHAVSSGMDERTVEVHALRADRARSSANVNTNRSNRQETPNADVVSAALCMARGLPNIEKLYKPEVLEAAHAKRHDISLQTVILNAAIANGYPGSPVTRISSGNVKEILEYAFPRVRAAASTYSLSGILGNVANKELLAGYEQEDMTWKEVSQTKSVSNFHAVTSYRMLDSMEYEEVGPDGKIKHGTAGQESYTRQAKTYAKMFALTRQDIINDDLGAFDDIRSRLGRGSAQKFNNVFWTKFLTDHATFFTAARTNYISGATTNLGADGVGLGLGVKAFRTMTSPSADGTKRIGGNPDRLIVPPELEAIADALYRNQNLGATKTSDSNIYANKYRPVVVPWLSDSNFTGYSTTAWYLLRSPTNAPMMVVSFVNGQQTPTVESADADFDTLGIQFRGYHDFGCDQAEYLAGVKSKGAA